MHPQIRTNQPPHHPPYGLLQLAGIVDQLGYKVGIIDNNAFRLPIDAIRQEIKEDQWDVIGVGGLITQYRFIKELLPVFREEHPAALLIGGGGFLTSMPREMMRWLPELDIGVIGEAYLTLQEVLEHANDQDWKRVKGLVYRDGKNIKLSKMRPLIPEEDLDEIVPFPAYEFSPVQTYLQYSMIPYSPESMHPTCRRLDVLTSYGCPWRCTFCFHNGCTPYCQSKIYGKEVKGKQFRQHSPEYIVNLIQHLRLQYCINFVSFIDENMTVNKKWFASFCDVLEESGLATLINWGMVCHSTTVGATLLRKARDVGCAYISYGGESTSKKLLKQMGKGQTKLQMSAAIDATHAAGINPIMSFIIGFPETTIDDLIGDAQFSEDYRIFFNPFFLQPYPGSQLYREHKDLIIQQHLTDDEREFIESDKIDLDLYAKVFIDKVVSDLTKEKAEIPSKRQLQKKLPLLKEKVKDAALERWVTVLDDATKLSVNLTDFNDVELAGLRYMIHTWDVRRLEHFKKLKELHHEKE